MSAGFAFLSSFGSRAVRVAFLWRESQHSAPADKVGAGRRRILHFQFPLRAKTLQGQIPVPLRWKVRMRRGPRICFRRASCQGQRRRSPSVVNSR
jgi:hypothetical protein